MARLLRWPVLLTIALCALAVMLAVTLPGRVVEAPGQSGTFGFSACAPPCWAGITVGETALVDVSERFQRNIAALNKAIDFASNGAVYWGLTDQSAQLRSAAFSGNLLAAADEVSYVHLNLNMPVWYLLLTLGSPVEVELHEPFPDVHRLEIVMRWTLPGASAVATIPVKTVDDWGLNASASSISFLAPGQNPGYGRSQRPYHIIGQTAWQGFVPVAHYLLDASAG